MPQPPPPRQNARIDAAKLNHAFADPAGYKAAHAPIVAGDDERDDSAHRITDKIDLTAPRLSINSDTSSAIRSSP
jgi:hypothetical protein